MSAGGGVWEYISASRLNLWLKCPLAFKLRYVDEIRFPTTRARFLGKVVHRVLEQIYRHRQLGIELPTQDVADRIVAAWRDLADEEPLNYNAHAAMSDGIFLVGRLIEAYLQQIPPEDTLAVETELSAPLIDPVTGEDLGIRLLGIVDLIVRQEDGPLIVDFKTANRSGGLPGVVHEVQLSCYSYLLRQSAGLTEGALEIRNLVKTRQPEIEFQRYTAREPRHYRRLFHLIRAYLDDLRSERFLYRPSWGCSWCEFRQRHCDQWDPIS